MDEKSRAWLALAAAHGFIGVAAGGFAAHGIADPSAQALLRTGGEYELIHAVAAMTCAVLWGHGLKRAGPAAWLFLAGAAVFSWSLYLIALTGQRWLGAITPLGGLAFLAGWALLGWAVLQKPR